jgi:hypothetical protein
VKVNTGGRSNILMAIYRPHSGTVEEFIDVIQGNLDRDPSLASSDICILGDFNVNLLDVESNHTKLLTGMLQSFHFYPTK